MKVKIKNTGDIKVNRKAREIIGSTKSKKNLTHAPGNCKGDRVFAVIHFSYIHSCSSSQGGIVFTLPQVCLLRTSQNIWYFVNIFKHFINMKMFSSNGGVLPEHCFLFQSYAWIVITSLNMMHVFLLSWFWWVRSKKGWLQVKEAWTSQESKTMSLGTTMLFCFNRHLTTFKSQWTCHANNAEVFHTCIQLARGLFAYPGKFS